MNITTIFSTMSSIGGFCEKEIDGKSFHIFTLKDNPSSSSGETFIDSGDDNDLTLQPLFLCPTLRVEAERLKRKENGYSSVDDNDFLLFNTPPHFPNRRSGVDPQVQNMLDSDNDDDGDICKLPLLPLFWCNNKEPYDDIDFNCLSCASPEIGSGYYLCPTCDEIFHKECVESPLFIKHPSYPFLSLQLYTLQSHLHKTWSCISCENSLTELAYHCPTYNVILHPVCLTKPIPILIDHPKRHPHSLTFFPKQNSLLCNVCGVINPLFPTYVCARCVFVVHQDCIYFPYVIRISRHQHRISFTYSLPSGALSCGVCRKKVDNHCGAYSCNKCVDYFVHSRCALRKDLWDREELEGVPEEPEIVVEPFEMIADGIILHFSHGHHLKLELISGCDKDKFCQACILPIYEGNYYSCVDRCDFILHEACANAPCKKHHPLHFRSLRLKVVPAGYKRNQSHFHCQACMRQSGGFVYEDSTRDWPFKLDVRCASISEPFKYEGHEHPLFLALTREEEKSAVCQICEDTSPTTYYSRKLNCIECDYIICFKCATLPYKAKYKHDKHLLTLRKLTEESDQAGWCEVCEQKIVYSKDYGFYSCDDYYCTTLHVDCLLGKDPYMKPGQTIDIHGEEFHTFPNNTMSRPFCHGRKCDRCLDKVVLQKNNLSFCSFYCASIERYA